MYIDYILILVGIILLSFENFFCEEKDNMNIVRLCCYDNYDFFIFSILIFSFRVVLLFFFFIYLIYMWKCWLKYNKDKIFIVVFEILFFNKKYIKF